MYYFNYGKSARIVKFFLVLFATLRESLLDEEQEGLHRDIRMSDERGG
jgi:hypothetical protein